ncbi:hypothetical protein GCM10008090_15310 [Arenicella chitinivorans]|uniref:Uncharacterized protein n=1 Tax=Arenicella chitinivorans TaxID=1329800 RepID=A0A918RR39_9GAMM|nr:hypothetical protein GCM10008090_15310 [Arenicella chitinivorans]
MKCGFLKRAVLGSHSDLAVAVGGLGTQWLGITHTAAGELTAAPSGATRQLIEIRMQVNFAEVIKRE